jgi:hypothetical protein
MFIRALFFLGILAIIGLIVTGAIQLQRTDDTITIEINKQRVAEDAKKVVGRGREVLRKAEASLDKEIETK